MSIINFTVQYDLYASQSDSADTGVDADIVPLMGEVRFTPLTTDDKAVQAPTYSPRPAGIKLLPFFGYMDSDGQLKAGPGGAVGVRLWANDPVLGLSTGLTYRVDFDLRTPVGKKVTVDGGYFSAPSVDGTVNLADVLTSTGSPVVGLGGGGDNIVYAQEIVDSTTVGRALITAASAAAVQAVAAPTATAVKTAAYTASPGQLVLADATSGGFTVTLPASPAAGSTIWVKKTDTTANTVLVQRTGTDTFNTATTGPSTLQLVLPGESVELSYRSGVWYVVNHSVTPAGLDTAYANLDGFQTLSNKQIVLPSVDALYVLDSELYNQSHVVDQADGRLPWLTPASKYQWVDALRFSRVVGTPSYETFDGTTWSSAGLNTFHFSGKTNESVVVADGSSLKGGRWTWNNSAIATGRIRWWNIFLGFVSGSPTPSNTFVIEKSSNGSTWTTLHTSTAQAIGSSVWLSASANTNNYLRLTITTNNNRPVNIGSIKALTNRLDVFPQEYELPLDWDNSRNVTVGTTAGARSDGALNVGTTSTTTAAGGIYIGNDVNLYRSAANTLKTDDNLIIAAPGTVAGSAATIDGSQSLTNKNLTSGTNTFPTFNQNTTGSAATLTTARTIGGVSFNGSANIDLPGVNTAGTQNTSGTAAGLSDTLAVGSGGTGVTTITGLVKGTGTTAMVAATAGTDYVTPGGALGTPSSGTLTNCTGLPLAGIAATVLIRSIQTVTSTVTLGGNANTDYVVFIGASGVVTLPTAVGNTSRYTIKCVDTASKTLATTSSQTIDGSTSFVLTVNTSIDLVSDGSNWRIV